MITAKKRKLVDEIGEGIEAYRDRRDSLPRRKLSARDVKVIREQFGMSQSEMATFLNARMCRRRPR